MIMVLPVDSSSKHGVRGATMWHNLVAEVMHGIVLLAEEAGSQSGCVSCSLSLNL